MASKRPEINKFQEAFSTFYNEVIENYGEEAFCLGKSARQIYSYGDFREQTNNMKAHEIIFSTNAHEIILFLLDNLENQKTQDTDGRIDDEWAELSEIFARVRIKFQKGDKIDYSLKSQFMNMAERLFEEWKERP